jgi:quercetin dioxygenase-like cupin family protein/uncharacterized protein YrrD
MIMVEEWKARPDRPVEVPLLHVQLAGLLERLRQEPTWRTRGRNAITLAKEAGLRLVLMLLGKGTKISEHQAAGPLTFHVLTGSVTFRAGVRVESLESGELIVLESSVAHEVEALEESACLLTLAAVSLGRPQERPGSDKDTTMLRSMNDLIGFTIAATDGDIGRVDACYFDDESFTVRHLVVDTGGWLGGRKVLISPMALRDIDWYGGRIEAALTRVQVEKSPSIDTDRPVSRQHEAEYHRYYGYPFYWTGPYLWGPYSYPYPFLAPDRGTNFEQERRWTQELGRAGDPHLRSSATVIGYHVAATDGDIGHVKDFLMDESTWAIRYLVVDTSNWWFGKKVLVSPEWVTGVDWNESLVHVDLTRERIKNSPEYDRSGLVERDYEVRLHDHYGRPGYWSDRRDEAALRRR